MKFRICFLLMVTCLLAGSLAASPEPGTMAYKVDQAKRSGSDFVAVDVFAGAADLSESLTKDRFSPHRAATEVLAIIAYHEPVSRAEIESIRGVQTSAGTLDVLMEAGWIKLAGRREVPGRPVIYATTPEFLDHFGLQSRRDLPGIDELKAAGLLDPVDEAFEEAMGAGSEADGEEPSESAGDDPSNAAQDQGATS